MALSNITVKGLTPDLTVLGAYQRLTFDSDPLTKFQLFNLFSPTDILTDAQNNMEFRNYRFCGYRFNQITHFDELERQGKFKFQYFLDDGSGVDIWSYDGVSFKFHVGVQFQSISSDLDMGSFKIINLGTPVNPTDAATKAYVDSIASSEAITLTGDVTGSGTTGAPFATTLTLHLNQILSPTGNVDLNSYKIVNLATPTLNTDATTKLYVDNAISSGISLGIVTLIGDITGTGTIGSSILTTFQLHLNEILPPTTSVSLNFQRLINVQDPFNPQDAVTKAYVDSRNLNNFFAPVIDLSFGGVRITDVANPILPSDGATKSYVDSSILSGTITLTGDVTGSGTTGTSFSTTLTLHLNQILSPTGNVDLNSQKIINLANPTLSTDAANKNYIDGKTWLSTQISDFIPAVRAFRLDQFATPLTDVNFGGYRITNLAAPFNPLDAVNKTYVDSLTVALPSDYSLPNNSYQSFITSSGSSINSFNLISLYAPILGFPGSININFNNSTSHGYRINHLTGLGDTYGSLNIQSTVSGTPSSSLLSITNTNITISIPSYFNSLLTMGANIDMGGFKIINIANPTNPTDAANKAYVDSVSPSTSITLSGDVTGSGTTGTPFATTLTLHLNQILSPTGDVNMASHKIINLSSPVNPTDAATKAYVDSSSGAASLTLTGQVYGTGPLSSPISVVLTVCLSDIATPLTNISMAGHKILFLADPTISTDAANKNYVDSKTWTSSQISDFSTSVIAFRLDQFALPTGSLNLNNQKIINLGTPTLSTDATTKAYVDGKTWLSTQISDFIPAVRAFRLDQFATPLADVNFGGFKITNLADPINPSDAVTKTYADSLTFNLPFDYNSASDHQSFNFATQVSEFKLKNNFVYTSVLSSQMSFDLLNYQGYGFRLQHITDTSLLPYGEFQFGLKSPGTLNVALSVTQSQINLFYPVYMNGNSINSIGSLAVGGISAAHGQIQIDNTFQNRKIILYEAFNNDFQFQGFGTTSSLLTYNVDATSSDHVWYAATSSSARNELFRVRGNGAVIVSTTGTLYGKKPVGCMYTQGNVTSNTLTPATWAKINGTTIASSLNNQFTMPSSNRLTYGGEQTGTFIVNCMGDYSVTGGNSTASFSIYKNGVQISPFQINMNGSAANGIMRFSAYAIVSLVATDYIEVFVKNTTAVTLTVQDMCCIVSSI